MNYHEMPRPFLGGFQHPSRNLKCSMHNWRKSRWSDLRITGEIMTGRNFLTAVLGMTTWDDSQTANFSTIHRDLQDHQTSLHSR